MIWFLGLCALSGLWVAACVCVVLAAELAWPREELMAARSRLNVLIFAALFIPMEVFANSTIRLHYAPAFPGFGAIDALIAVLVYDFFYYWFHRAQHTIPFLWRIHSVHHSIEKMGAGAAYHHGLEAPLKALCVAIPAHLLFGPGVWQLGLLAMVHGYYVHSTTRLSFGPVAVLVNDNRTHRIHHSRDPAHFNRNFGFPFLLWDHVFGTAYIPKGEEWCAVGLDEMREPRTVAEWLVPWRRSGNREALEDIDVREPARRAVDRPEADLVDA